MQHVDRLIIGCGYLGNRVADRWLAAGLTVAALTRSEQRAESFRERGLLPIVGDVCDRDSLSNLPETDVLLHAVGWDRGSGVDQRSVYVDGFRNVLEAMRGRVKHIVHVSSTSVYGQADGSAIDEDSPTEPTRDSGRVCLDAEDLLLRWIPDGAGAVTGVILRFAGIYGPNRTLARIETLRNGGVIPGNPDGWLNLIHVEDGADAVLAVSDKTFRSTPAIAERFLVCDNEPVRRRDYYTALAERVDASAPVFETETKRDPDRPGRADPNSLGKRCDNTWLRSRTDWQPRFPSYREGLDDAVRNLVGE